jgi:hypothetical protein
MDERSLSFQEALSWLNAHVGDEVTFSVAAGSERSHRNWGVQLNGRLAIGPGERQLIDHRGGAVRDYLVGEARLQLVEDDLRDASVMTDGASQSLNLDFEDAQMNFEVSR